MRSLEFRDQSLEIRELRLFKACAKQVNVRTTSLCINSEAIHMKSFSELWCVRKLGTFTQPFMQLPTLLYTSFGQLFTSFVSVKIILVHILHSAYKESYYLNKGLYV